MSRLKQLSRATLIAATLAAGSALAAADSKVGSNELIQQGDALTAQGRIQEAETFYRQAVEAAPDHGPAYFKLAGNAIVQGRYADGVKSYQRFISLDGSDAKAFIGMGAAYVHMGRYQLAKAAFEEALRMDPARKEALGGVIVWLDQRAQGPMTGSR